jgi:hypothetical protein
VSDSVLAPKTSAGSQRSGAPRHGWSLNAWLRIQPGDKDTAGRARFAIAISILNILGHTFLGFEQAWIVPFVALGTGYATELIGETINAWAMGKKPRFAGAWQNGVKFLLSAHITSLAVGMLLYSADNFAAVAFGTATAIASKYALRVVVEWRNGQPVTRHFLNPSNFGITVTLLLFPTVGIAPPYQFTENTFGFVDWLLPLLVICTGSYLNLKATGKIPLILAWAAAFATQALLRAAINGTPWESGLIPMSGFAFILFTFYMITDPATTPKRPGMQVLFAIGVAVAYAIIMELHIVFGMFYALTAVTACRGIWLATRIHAPSLTPRSASQAPTSLSPVIGVAARVPSAE